MLLCYTFIHTFCIYSTSFLNVHRTGVEEEYSERDHLQTELREVYLFSQDKKNVSPVAKKEEKKDLEMAKSMRQAILETYAKTKATSASDE